MRSAQGERGSGTVLVIGATGVLTLVVVAALVLASAVRDVHRAAGVADRAALAAALPTADGGGPDCRAAREVAAADGARLDACARRPDGSVDVVVSLPVTTGARWPGLPARTTARARAGAVFSRAQGHPVESWGHTPMSRGGPHEPGRTP